ncbi:MAG: hypothetical protein A2V70_04895 [Planctomycetes bacterium RBG_13_63_9]|nr:MAG: hypothetical protein A2V70_04895 [Planctomycetes bacterium RBG_13_63_9]
MSSRGQKPARRISGQTIFLAVVVVISFCVFGYLVFLGDGGRDGNGQASVSRLRLEDIPFNGARAYEYLKQLCAIGPRRSGSPGMAQQQELLESHFRKLGGQVELQRFRVRHPVDGSAVPMANLIVRWHPERARRILLGTHYDTLPLPMLDPVDKQGTFIGANDGGSGVALLMELAHEMADLECDYGVDFVHFDGEEFIFERSDRYFLGSEHFARMYVKQQPPYRYHWGVLLDMVGGAKMQLYQERYSLGWGDTRPLVQEIWATADRLGVREFVSRKGVYLRDDHLMLHDVGKIPCCNVVDRDYLPWAMRDDTPWHTRADTADKCSALSLAKVGWVIREWLKAVR